MAPSVSDRSYGVAVALCMIFGTVGIHHFYLGNLAHGIFDLTLFIAGLSLFVFSSDPLLMALGLLLILADILHTIIVTYLLFIGKCRDGSGKLVVYPGQLD